MYILHHIKPFKSHNSKIVRGIKITEQYDFVLLANSYSSKFAKRVAHYLDHHPNKLNFKLDTITDNFYPDGSRFTQLGSSVRGNKVFILHNYLVGKPDQTNYDLFLIADALKRASEEGFILCPTYFTSRGDKKDEGRVPIPAKLYADLIQSSSGNNLKRFMTCHMHADQLQGFFDVPVDNLQALPLFGWYIKKRLFKKFYEQGTQSQHLAVLSPDEGSSKLAKAAASYLGVPLARRGKERDKFTDSSGEVKSEELNIGFNIEGRHILVFDDQMDTGGTLISSTKDLKETYGASSVWFLPTHLVASPKESPGQPLTAEEKLQNASSKPKLITTDTVYRSDEYIKQNSSWLHCVLSMAPFFGETIYRQINAMSVSIMYNKPEIFESILDQAFTEENFNYYNRESSQSELTKFLDT